MKLFKKDVLGICMNLKSHIAHIFYDWTFYHYTDVPIMSTEGEY